MRSWSEYKKTMLQKETLGSAAKENNVSLLKVLVRSGEDINAKDHRGYSALMLAAYTGSIEAVHFLLSQGADPNTSDHSGNTVLMGACFKGHLEIISDLIDFGADPKLLNQAGMSAADFAKTFGRKEALNFLEEKNLRPQDSSRIRNLIKLSVSALQSKPEGK